ncbi:hypothetical protein EV191_12265 [Tamaricihabitans halophyticus]|uniref:Uncharacterized protein n=1 Tax=Tamaricihabitans halophyticus TaxID=1262583 RepID=A0A4R2Q9H4_9PSEU|nr:hypothetical protein EV191_12265 [Tamaricihabitans halophyticus]
MIQDLHRYFPKDTVRLAVRSPEALRALYVEEHAVVLDHIIRGRAARPHPRLTSDVGGLSAWLGFRGMNRPEPQDPQRSRFGSQLPE